MSEEQVPKGHRLAAWLARAAVRAWPEESRKWGLALEAELSEIQGPGASLRWAIGGVMLLTRAWWNHLMRSWLRPAGVPEGGPLAELAKSASRVPRTPRFVTAILLVTSLAMLAVPDVREAIRATFRVWSGSYDRITADDHALIAQLRAEGEQHQDAQAIALVALHAADRSERMRMADRAVALDPSLTWIYAYVRTTDGLGSCCNNPLPTEWLEKLQKWDPDNAVPRMLIAHQSSLKFDQIWGGSGYGGGYEAEAVKYLKQDKGWVAAMEFVFQAPKYDYFVSREFDLYRAVAQRYGIRDLDATRSILWSNYLGRIGVNDATYYAYFLTERAEAAAQSGNIQEAESLFRQPAEFCERMAEQTHTQQERDRWQSIEGDSLRKLQAFLVKFGKSNEAVLVGVKVDALQTNRTAWGPARPWSWDENGWEGFMIRSFTAAILFLVCASLASLAILFWRRRAPVESRGIGATLASVAVDFCPLLLLFATAGLYVAYRPVALIYEQYMTWPTPIYDYTALGHALFTPYESPEGAWMFFNYFRPENYWLALIIGLSMLAGFIALRGVRRRRAVAS